MEKLADEKKMFYIIGDINIDINKTNQNSPQADRYIQVITSNGEFSLIVIVIAFTKLLPWPGDSEGTFRSSSQAATCPPVYHTRRRLHTVPLIAERQARKLWIPNL